MDCLMPILITSGIFTLLCIAAVLGLLYWFAQTFRIY